MLLPAENAFDSTPTGAPAPVDDGTVYGAGGSFETAAPVAAPVPAVNPVRKLIFVEPDPFSGGMKTARDFIPSPYARHDAKDVLRSKTGEEQTRSGAVSRPAGISIKPNTYATARVITSGGETLQVLNQVGASSFVGVVHDDKWTDWLLVAVQESRAEKTQIVETFGDTYIYAFGQHPRTLTFSGILLNTADYNWRATFWENWDKHFRATQLVQADARMYITFDDVLVEGYPMEAQAQQSANDPHSLNFSFTFFVTNYTNMTVQDSFVRESQNTLNFVTPGYDTMYNNGKVVDPTLTDDRGSIVRYLGSGGIMDRVNDARARIEGENPTDTQRELAGLATLGMYAALNLAAQAFYDPHTLSAESVGSNMVNSVGTGLSAIAEYNKVALEDKYNLKPGDVNKLIGWLSYHGSRALDLLDDKDLGNRRTKAFAKSVASILTGDFTNPVSKVGGMTGSTVK